MCIYKLPKNTTIPLILTVYLYTYDFFIFFMYTFCISYRRRKPIRQLNSTIELKNSYVYIIGDVFAWCPITKLSLRCIVSASPGQ